MNIFIVDDEKHNRDGLKLLIEKNFPFLNIVGEADSAKEARIKLAEIDIDVLLLDINMPKESGFDLLESLNKINFQIIFITAYSEYAIRAFKANAVDYLLKPVDIEELKVSIEKCKKNIDNVFHDTIQKKVYEDSIQNTVNTIIENKFPTKLTLPFLHGFQIVEMNDILHLEAEGNYTRLYFANGQKILVSRGMKEFDNLLDPKFFFRGHKSIIVNLNFIKEYNTQNGPTVIMNNGSKIPISRRRIDDFLNALNVISKKI